MVRNVTGASSGMTGGERLEWMVWMACFGAGVCVFGFNGCTERDQQGQCLCEASRYLHGYSEYKPQGGVSVRTGNLLVSKTSLGSSRRQLISNFRNDKRIV